MKDKRRLNFFTAFHLISSCYAFSTPSSNDSRANIPIGTSHSYINTYSTQSSTSLQMDFRSFFNNPFDNNDDDEKKIEEKYFEDEEDSDDGDYLGCTNIFKIKAKSLKVGGCRLYLSLFLIGEVNNPQRNTWKMDQNEEGGIDLYYNDATGAMMITFEDEEIAVNRMGSAPSMNYLMHETGVINGMLDQLDEIAFDTSIDEKDRLILLKEGDEIDVVRESLSFN